MSGLDLIEEVWARRGRVVGNDAATGDLRRTLARAAAGLEAAELLADEADRACAAPRRFLANEEECQQALSRRVARVRQALSSEEPLPRERVEVMARSSGGGS